MKKIKGFINLRCTVSLVLALTLGMLTGCGGDVRSPDMPGTKTDTIQDVSSTSSPIIGNDNTSDVDEALQNILIPNISVYQKADSNYAYVVDNRTGVVYLRHNYSDGRDRVESMTVMLNADGTPVTIDQLNIPKSKFVVNK